MDTLDLSGEWEFQEEGAAQRLVLDEKGNGTYSWQNGRIITTSVSGRQWEGMWYQEGNDREGSFALRLSDDGREAKGTWWYTRIGTRVIPQGSRGPRLSILADILWQQSHPSIDVERHATFLEKWRSLAAMNWKASLNVVKQTFAEWNQDNVPRLGAAMAYYTVVSIAPLLLVIIAVAAFAFGREAAEGAIVSQIQGLVGETAAQAIQGMIQNASKPSTGILATIIGIVTLLAGASGVFAELQAALNTIWKAPARPDSGLLDLVRARFLSLMMVLGMGFLLLVSLVLSAGLAALGSYAETLLPLPESVLHLISFVISFGVITLLFAMMYKILPDVPVAWNDVWMGAAVTAFLFTFGKFLIGIYIGKANFASTYGAAGSLVVILVWVYYSTQILLLGAEFTNVYARRHGSHKQIEEGRLAEKASVISPSQPGAAKTASFPGTPALSRTISHPPLHPAHPGLAKAQPLSRGPRLPTQPLFTRDASFSHAQASTGAGSDTVSLGARSRSIVNILLGTYMAIVTWRAATDGLQSTRIDHSGTN